MRLLSRSIRIWIHPYRRAVVPGLCYKEGLKRHTSKVYRLSGRPPMMSTIIKSLALCVKACYIALDAENCDVASQLEPASV